MGLDPRTPVIVGVGQVNEREDAADLEPVDLMAMAAHEAADPRVLQAVDAIRVVNLLSGATGIPACCSVPGSAPRMLPPTTPESAATPRSRWSTRPAWTSDTAAPAWCCWPAPRPGVPESG